MESIELKRARNRRFYLAHREKLLAKQRDYYLKHKDDPQFKARERERNKRRQPEKSKYIRDRYRTDAAFRAACAEYRRRFREANPEYEEMRHFLCRMKRNERLSRDPVAYAEHRERDRAYKARQYRAKNPGARPYKPQPQIRIPDYMCKGECNLRRGTFLVNASTPEMLQANQHYHVSRGDE